MKYVIVLGLILSSLVGVSQETWQKLYDRDYGSSTNSCYESAVGVINTSDGGYALLSRSEVSTVTTKDILIVKLDALGDTMWTSFYAGAADDIPTAMIESSLGGYVITGFTSTSGNPSKDAFVMRVDAVGDLQWVNYFAIAEDNKPWRLVENSGSYTIVGTTPAMDDDYNDAWLANVSESGTLNWSKTYGGFSNSEQGKSLAVLSDGSYVLFGEDGELGGDVFVSKLDANGTQIWTMSYDITGTYYAESIKETSDGGFILLGEMYGGAIGAGDYYLIKISSTGALEWSKAYGGVSGDYAFDVVEHQGGFVVIGGFAISTTTYLGLSKTDANGNLMWSKLYRSNYGVYSIWDGGINLELTPDNGFIFGSDMYNAFANATEDVYNGYDMYVVKADSNGYSYGCMVDFPMQEQAITFTATSGTLTESDASSVITVGALNLVHDDVILTFEDALIKNEIEVIPATCGAGCDGTAEVSLCDTLGFTCSGTDPYTFEWSGGQVGDSIGGLCAGTHTLTITDNSNCVTFVDVNVGVGAEVQPLCFVTVDENSQYNVLLWQKPITTGIDHYKIYRLITGNYTLIDSVPYDSLSQYTDTTNGINPNIQSYRYRISAVDTCGFESELSGFHETIHLQTSPSGSEIHLEWDDYIGFDFTYYRIWRDSTFNDLWELMDSTDVGVSTQWTDIDPPNVPQVRYMIEVVPDSFCITTRDGGYNSTRSNKPTMSGGGGNVLQAGFTASATTILAGESVAFLSNGTGAPDDYVWEFDGASPNTSVAANPNNINYASPGSYRVKLKVTDATAADSMEVLNYITVLANNGQPPATEFLSSANSIVTGQSVDFTDLSSNSPTTWSWVFTNGDPSSSNDQHPTGITYNTEGSHPVALTTSNINGSNTELKSGFITVGPNGVSQLSQAASFRMYPNPSDGTVNIDVAASENVSITIYNSLGQEMQTIVSSGEHQLKLPAGMYFVVSKGEVLLTHKLLVR